MRIDSSGRLLVGTTLSTSIATREASIQVASTALAPNVLSGLNTSADQYGPSIALAKSRGGESPAVTSGDALGSIIFAGHDGSDLETAGAYISAQVDGAVSNNDLPTRLVFSCTPDGAASPTPRMTIKADGDVGIGTTSPGRNLHIASSGNSTLAVERTGATTAALVISAESNVIKLSARETESSSAVGRDIQFESGPTATMRIDSSGRLLVGTSSALTTAADLNSAKTQVSGNLAVTGITGTFSEIYGLASTAAQVVDFVLDDGACYMMTLFKHNSPSGSVGNAGTYLLSRSGASVTAATVLAADGITSVAVDGSTYKPEFSPNTANLRIYHVSLIRLA
jgi:hypothetical protein